MGRVPVSTRNRAEQSDDHPLSHSLHYLIVIVPAFRRHRKDDGSRFPSPSPSVYRLCSTLAAPFEIFKWRIGMCGVSWHEGR